MDRRYRGFERTSLRSWGSWPKSNFCHQLAGCRAPVLCNLRIIFTALASRDHNEYKYLDHRGSLCAR